MRERLQSKNPHPSLIAQTLWTAQKLSTDLGNSLGEIQTNVSFNSSFTQIWVAADALCIPNESWSPWCAQYTYTASTLANTPLLSSGAQYWIFTVIRYADILLKHADIIASLLPCFHISILKRRARHSTYATCDLHWLYALYCTCHTSSQLHCLVFKASLG